MVNDILTHLHVDHYADVPYMLPFTASVGRYKPLRRTGPSGRTPELGTKAKVAGMKTMLRWYLEEFDTCPRAMPGAPATLTGLARRSAP